MLFSACGVVCPTCFALLESRSTDRECMQVAWLETFSCLVCSLGRTPSDVKGSSVVFIAVFSQWYPLPVLSSPRSLPVVSYPRGVHVWCLFLWYCSCPFPAVSQWSLPVVCSPCGLPVVSSLCGLPVVSSPWGLPVACSPCGLLSLYFPRNLPVISSPRGLSVVSSPCGIPVLSL